MFVTLVMFKDVPGCLINSYVYLVVQVETSISHSVSETAEL